MTTTKSVTRTFAELTDQEKQIAREAYTDEGYLSYDWWNRVYEDAARVGEILGIQIDTRGKNNEPNINFSGFSSQGDGACFKGFYKYRSEAVVEIENYCSDSTLIEIANDLYILQLACRVMGIEPFTATITLKGSYCDSHSMNVDIHYGENDDCQIDFPSNNAVSKIMHNFADWIYASLEADHNYMYSDEYVDQYLAEETFDKDGDII